MSAKTTPYRSLEGHLKANGLSLDKMAMPSDGSFEPEADAVDTLNELSLS